MVLAFLGFLGLPAEAGISLKMATTLPEGELSWRGVLLLPVQKNIEETL